jgi:hypothetical protein
MNIQIMKTYNESFLNVRSHKMEWLRVASGPVLLWLAGFAFLVFAHAVGGVQIVDIHKSLTGGVMVEGHESALMVTANIIYQFAYGIAMISLYINGYRYAVLEEAGDRWFTFNLNRRFVKMFLYGLLVALFAVIYVAIAAGVIMGVHTLAANMGLDVTLGIIFALVGIFLLFRILLYPVVISLDQGEPLSTSWRLMKGNIFRFIGLTLLVSLTIVLIGALGGAILGIIGFLLAAISPALTVVSVILWVLFALAMIILAWAVNSKLMGLIFLSLSMNKESTPVIEG